MFIFKILTASDRNIVATAATCFIRGDETGPLLLLNEMEREQIE